MQVHSKAATAALLSLHELWVWGRGMADMSILSQNLGTVAASPTKAKEHAEPWSTMHRMVECVASHDACHPAKANPAEDQRT